MRNKFSASTFFSCSFLARLFTEFSVLLTCQIEQDFRNAMCCKLSENSFTFELLKRCVCVSPALSRDCAWATRSVSVCSHSFYNYVKRNDKRLHMPRLYQWHSKGTQWCAKTLTLIPCIFYNVANDAVCVCLCVALKVPNVRSTWHVSVRERKFSKIDIKV